eukprot:comp25653_c0_seq1/m.47020 comp25653_c0_seq1/g.47020  ORF comp25653_c0_seq1/g.47020 comp25653_c0_seq1/m.47020 type:complete len:267 (-) comp25653_c0_seq1:529-1329(-)
MKDTDRRCTCGDRRCIDVLCSCKHRRSYNWLLKMSSALRLFNARAAAFPLSEFTSFSRKVVCVGRNYAEHVKELKNEMPSASEPVIFLKPSSSLLPEGSGPIRLPKGSEVHHEVELGLVVATPGSDIPQDQAMSHIGGYCLALDLTARNLQEKAKKKGLPWSVAKGYDTFTPISGLIEKEAIPNPQEIRLWCKVDNETRQDGNTRDMMYNLPFLVSYISSIMTLERGDIILTGTPAGVGPIRAGQKIHCGLGENVAAFTFDIVDRQ